MTASQFARLTAVLLILGICVSCGDVFRPVAIPVTPIPPDPSSFHFSLILSRNGSDNPGASSRIDVSGDTNVGVARVGVGPVHAAVLPSGSRIFVANTTEDSVSSYSPGDATTVATVSLPVGSGPAFVATTQNDSVYVANPGNDTVSVIAVNSNVVTRTIPVGRDPFAMAETPDSKKLYVANRGDGVTAGSVTSINISDKSSNAPINTGSAPTWVVARSDSSRVYVLDGSSGTISVIDVSSDAIISQSIVLPGADFMYYARTLNRLYVTIPSSRTVAVLDVSGDVPVPLATIDLTVDPNGGADIPCPAGCTIGSITSLPDGSRVYIATYQSNASCSAGEVAPCIASHVTVASSSNNRILKTLSVGAMGGVSEDTTCDAVRFRRHIAAAADGTRVYVTNCDAGSTAVVRTSDDSFVLDIVAPVSSLPPPTNQPTSRPPPQSPLFVLSGH